MSEEIEQLKLLIEEYEESYKQSKYEGNIEEYESLKNTYKLLKKVLNCINKLQEQLDQLKEVDRQICCEELITKDKYQDILKENEELKGIKNGTTIEYIGKATYWRKDKIEKYFINKDIIRDKIKELENTYSEHSEFRIGKTIEVLEELLGGE